MPIYEYRCKDCGEHLEKRQSISDEPLTKCETCGGLLEKQWSLSGFQFKGAGWYVTDYSGNKGAKEKTGEKSEKAEKPASSESTDKSTAASNKSETSKKSES